MRTAAASSVLLGIVVAYVGCSSDTEDAPTGGVTSGGATGGTGGNGGSGGGGEGIGGFIDPSEEVCDGIDNDSDGTIDEVCTCELGAVQQCYPSNTPPPEGCSWGEQSCEGSGSWAPCSGATLPPEGEDACCTALGDTPTHAAHDAFVAAYPFANMPKTWPDIEAFMPATHGGIIAANIEAGRALAWQAAVAALPPGAAIASVREDPVLIEILGGTAPCDGMGWGWGSILYQTPDQAVFEVVYLYIGYCAAGPPSGDIEAFYYSQSPVVTCEPPIIPR
jgi:hypothetical protein